MSRQKKNWSGCAKPSSTSYQMEADISPAPQSCMTGSNGSASSPRAIVPVIATIMIPGGRSFRRWRSGWSTGKQTLRIEARVFAGKIAPRPPVGQFIDGKSRGEVKEMKCEPVERVVLRRPDLHRMISTSQRFGEGSNTASHARLVAAVAEILKSIVRPGRGCIDERRGQALRRGTIDFLEISRVNR